MKNVIFTTLAALLVLSTASKSMAADELVDLLKCRPTNSYHDVELSLTLSTGGLSGLTLLKVERYYFGRISEKTYVVRQLPVNTQVGQPVIFVGEDICFEADFNSATTDGAAPAILKLRLGTGDFSFEYLSCQTLETNPVVNYTY